jgi:hypothetical protein
MYETMKVAKNCFKYLPHLEFLRYSLQTKLKHDVSSSVFQILSTKWLNINQMAMLETFEVTKYSDSETQKRHKNQNSKSESAFLRLAKESPKFIC